MDSYEKAKMDKGRNIIIAVFILIGIFFYIVFSSYKPEDLSKKPILEQVILNECNEHRIAWLHTEPGNDGRTAAIPSCHDLVLDVYEVRELNGQNWLLVRNTSVYNEGPVQGWINESAVSPMNK